MTVRTKWDLTDDVERAYLERVPFGNNCTACDEYLATEGDFARHFHVPDARYRNLGECPKGHDCAGENEPGLRHVTNVYDDIEVEDPTVDYQVWECVHCGKDWWNIDGTNYDPAEWASPEEVRLARNEPPLSHWR